MEDYLFCDKMKKNLFIHVNMVCLIVSSMFSAFITSFQLENVTRRFRNLNNQITVNQMCNKATAR